MHLLSLCKQDASGMLSRDCNFSELVWAWKGDVIALKGDNSLK